MSDNSSDNKKKVLVIAYGFPPIAYVGVYRTLRFCKYLPSNGWLPEIITIQGDNKIYNDYDLLTKIPKEIKIHRTRNIDIWRSLQYEKIKRLDKTDTDTASPKPLKANGLRSAAAKTKNIFRSIILNLFSIPDHMLFWVPFATMKGMKLLRESEYDIIYTTSPPHSEHLAGLLLSALSKKPWIADCRDPIMDNFSLADLSRAHFISNKYLEKLIMRFADKVIFASEHYSSILKERYPSLGHKITVIRNGFDPEQFDKIEADAFDKFTIVYTGSMYGTITPDFFMKGLSLWMNSRESDVRNETQVLIHGWGNAKAASLAKELGIDDIVQVKGYIPQEEIIKKQKGADLLLLIVGFDEKSKGVVTSKIYEYIATGCHILAIVPEGEALRLLKDYQRFYHVMDDDYECLFKALDTAFADYLTRKSLPVQERNPYRLEESVFNAKNQVRALVNIFEESMQLG